MISDYYSPSPRVLDKLVQTHFDSGWGIYGCKIKPCHLFISSAGTPGNQCEVLSVDVLLKPKQQNPVLHAHGNINLYPPPTKQNIILINHAEGNWLAESEELKLAISKLLSVA